MSLCELKLCRFVSVLSIVVRRLEHGWLPWVAATERPSLLAGRVACAATSGHRSLIVCRLLRFQFQLRTACIIERVAAGGVGCGRGGERRH